MTQFHPGRGRYNYFAGYVLGAKALCIKVGSSQQPFDQSKMEFISKVSPLLASTPTTARECFNDFEGGPHKPCGIPGPKPRVPMKDVYTLAIQLSCLSVATLSIFWAPLAIKLGQVDQLIVIGLLLAVMGLCLESQAKSAALVFAGSRGPSTIQDFDALMRKDLFASKVRRRIRVWLLLLLSLPLGLAVAYKRFTGGHTTSTVHFGSGSFGITAAPGKQLIGNGLSLCSDLYTPFWIDPATNQTYGFNLYIADNETAVIVDAPRPDYLTGLMSNLGENQTISLIATVNATVSRMVNLTVEQRGSESYWGALSQEFSNSPTTNGGDAGAYTGLWAGMTGSNLPRWARSNYSVIFLSSWNQTKKETFQSTAIRTELTRELARAEWLVTPSSVTLAHTTLLPKSAQPNQDIIQSNLLGLQEMFSAFVDEFNWANRVHYNYPYPGSTATMPRWYQPVNTVPALSAAMLWSRVSSLDGPKYAVLYPETVTGYSKAEDDITTTKTYPTLKRSPLLLIVLLINPLLSISCVGVKALLYRTPIGDGFNSISMLAAAGNCDLSVLKGATLTGELKRQIPVSFTIARDDEGQDIGSLSVIMSLDARVKAGRVEHDIVYS